MISERRREYLREYRKRNRGKINAYARQWARENRDKRREYETNWRAAQPDKVKEINAKAGAKWATNNKGKKNALTAKRRAALRRQTPAWSDCTMIAKIYEQSAALTEITGIAHEVDHSIPLSGEFVSGLHVPANLQIVTKEHNRKKGNKYAGIGSLRIQRRSPRSIPSPRPRRAVV